MTSPQRRCRRWMVICRKNPVARRWERRENAGNACLLRLDSCRPMNFVPGAPPTKTDFTLPTASSAKNTWPAFARKISLKLKAVLRWTVKVEALNYFFLKLMNQLVWFTSSTRVQNYRFRDALLLLLIPVKPSSIPLFQPPIRMWFVLLFLFYLPSGTCFNTRGWVSFVKFRHGIFGRALKVFSSCNLHLFTSDYLYKSILNLFVCHSWLSSINL